MNRLYLLIIIILIGVTPLSGQEFDVTNTSSIIGTSTISARNSITLGPNFSYTPSGGNLTVEIQNPVVVGFESYTSTLIDPETRILDPSYLPGTTNGNFNIDLSGAASYSIPIESPPGVNGLAPRISLTYSSGSGSNIAGYGWNFLVYQALCVVLKIIIMIKKLQPLQWTQQIGFILTVKDW